MQSDKKDSDVETDASKQPRKFGFIDVVGTLILGGLSFLVSSLMGPIFERIRADEPVVFSMFGLFLSLAIWYCLYEKEKHGSIWIATFQGFIILCSAFFPVAAGEPGAERIIVPIVFALIGSFIVIVSILAITKVFDDPPIRSSVEGLFCMAVGIMSFVVAWPLPGGIPSGLIKWILQLITIYIIVFVGLRKFFKGK
jgi:hypothetical protein